MGRTQWLGGVITSRLRILRVAVAVLVLVQGNFASNQNDGGFSFIAGARAQATPKVPAFIILGDSTVDAGLNNYITTIIKCNWQPYGVDFPGQVPTGRFCDGKLAVDFLAEKMGLPFPLPYLAPNANGPAILTGVNVASSGSGYYDLTAKQLSVINLPQQVEWVKDWQSQVIAQVGNVQATQIFSEAIFAISTGSNDWINNYYTNLPLQESFNHDKTAYANVILGLVENRIQDLYDLGARRVAILSLPPMGCVPAEILLWNGSGKCIDFMTEDSLNFNAALQTLINGFSAPGLKVIYIDIYTMIDDAFYNPSKYGIIQPTDEVCCTLFNLPSFGPICQKFSHTCPTPSEYLFWDAFHPTEFFNAQLADAAWAVTAPQFGIPV